jgi:hypothetical protein
MAICLRRREFITLLGGAAAWPLAARAQQGNRVRRIGVLLAGEENDPLWKRRLSTFAQALADLGWTDGRNLRTDVRSARGDTNRLRALAQDLVGLQPDIGPASACVNAERRSFSSGSFSSPTRSTPMRRTRPPCCARAASGQAAAPASPAMKSRRWRIVIRSPRRR